MIPGGHLEGQESLVECCKREMREETGTVINPHTQYLTLEEYYHEWYFKSHYFICDYIGECEQSLTEAEKKRGLEARWIDFDEAMQIFGDFEKYKEIDEVQYGAYYRDWLALKEIQNNKNQGVYYE